MDESDSISKSVEFDLNKDDYFKLFVSQIIKDFNDEKFSSDILLLNNRDTLKLVELVKQFVKDLYLKNSSNFFQLFYVLDIPENKLLPFIHANEVNWDGITDLINKRVFLKVLFKEKYSNL